MHLPGYLGTDKTERRMERLSRWGEHTSVWVEPRASFIEKSRRCAVMFV